MRVNVSVLISATAVRVLRRHHAVCAREKHPRRLRNSRRDGASDDEAADCEYLLDEQSHVV